MPTRSGIISEQIDKVFSRFDFLDRPGCAVAVLHESEVIHTAGYGCAQLEYGIPITPTTVFHVASVSKQFTCCAIILLAQRGALSLDDDIRKHIPELHDFGHTITIRHLAHHTSGLRDQWTLLQMAGWRQDDVITQEHLLKMLYRQRDLNFDPGAEHVYCNSGYTLLAEIVRRVSDSFTRFCEQEIFEPCTMVDTHVHDSHQKVVPNRAYSYEKVGNTYENRVLSFANCGATSLFTTVEDLAKWMGYLETEFAEESDLGRQLLERDPLNNGDQTGYAFGLAISKWRGVERIQHSGSDAGFRSHLLMIPDHRFGVAVLSNGSDSGPADLAHEIADFVLRDILEPKPAREPEIWGSQSSKIDREQKDRLIGRWHFQNDEILDLIEAGGEIKLRIGESEELITLVAAEKELQDEEKGIRISLPAESTGHLETRIGNRKGNATRIEPQTLSETAREEYVGTYVSRELETRYHLLIEDGSVLARHQRHQDVPLRHIGTDRLQGDQGFFRRLTFTRSTRKIDGFLLDGGGRVRNLRFERIDLAE